ncbi:MAG: hypothetical protein ACYTE2_00030 [Planctomycetota bacterium]|jgi:putative methionine-R-sulfoxide reductase with GAF domain
MLPRPAGLFADRPARGGEAYVACDPLDRSEVVLPLRDARGVWGVLDLDSRSIGAFDRTDADALEGLIERSGIGRPSAVG